MRIASKAGKIIRSGEVETKTICAVGEKTEYSMTTVENSGHLWSESKHKTTMLASNSICRSLRELKAESQGGV